MINGLVSLFARLRCQSRRRDKLKTLHILVKPKTPFHVTFIPRGTCVMCPKTQIRISANKPKLMACPKSFDRDALRPTKNIWANFIRLDGLIKYGK